MRSETEQKTESFKSRDFVIEVTDGQYPQFVKFQCVQDRTEIVSEVNVGDEITVHFDLRGREWQGKYFTNLNAWRVNKKRKEGNAPATAPASTPTTAPAKNEAVKADDNSDLPF